jgi:hypothetical protein
MKIVKFISVFSLVLYLFILWNSADKKQVDISFSELARISTGDANFHSAVHNCAWDGDDVLTEKLTVDLAPGYVTSGILTFHMETPSMAAHAIWQPPKIS